MQDRQLTAVLYEVAEPSKGVRKPASEAERLEHDAVGPITVPSDRLWAANTARALRQLRISDERMPREFIYALAWVKQAAARVNVEMARLDARTAWAIERAAAEVIQGQHDDQFPLVIWQTASGMQTDTNFNEVIANRASELLGGQRGSGRRVHPREQVNLGQSSADVFAMTMHVAAVIEIADRLLPGLERLRLAVQRKAAAALDATPEDDAAPLARRLAALAVRLEAAENAIAQTLPALYEIELARSVDDPEGDFGRRVAAALSASLDQPFVVVARLSDAPTHEPLVVAHAALRALASVLVSMAAEVGGLPSGATQTPQAAAPGVANGKNAQCDAMTMLCHQVIANDISLSLVASAGNGRRSALQPLIIHNVLQSLRLLTDGMRSFAAYAIADLETAPAQLTAGLERSLMLVTALVPHIGYRKAAEIARKAHAERITLRDAALALGLVSPSDFDRWVQRDLSED